VGAPKRELMEAVHGGRLVWRELGMAVAAYDWAWGFSSSECIGFQARAPLGRGIGGGGRCGWFIKISRSEDCSRLGESATKGTLGPSVIRRGAGDGAEQGERDGCGPGERFRADRGAGWWPGRKVCVVGGCGGRQFFE